MVLGGTFLLLPMFSSIQTQLFSMEGPCQAQPVFPSHVASCTQVLVVARVILLQFIAKICATACETFLLSHSPGGVSEAKLGVWGELWLCTAWSQRALPASEGWNVDGGKWDYTWQEKGGSTPGQEHPGASPVW